MSQNNPKQGSQENCIDRWLNKKLKRKEKRLELREARKEAKFRWLEKRAGLTHQKAFFLVFWMLVSLTLLVIGIVGFPLLLKAFVKQSVKTTDVTNVIFDSEMFSQVLDYSKWVISALLAAFGAWIGAGAAYFFSKESLKESSRATEEALKIQQQFLGKRPAEKVYVKDLNLTAMNPKFMFDPSEKLTNLEAELNKRLSYWFIPIVNAKSGILEDVIASQAVHKYIEEIKLSNANKIQKPKVENKEKKKQSDKDDESKESPTVNDLINYLDKEPGRRKLHGLNTFFIKIKLKDSLTVVADQMKSADTAVAIVVDEKGKPTHCLTRTDIGSMLKPEG